jgi:hypothetical protein
VRAADTTQVMSKSSRANPGKEMVTVYGKITKELADRLDAQAEDRRWSRAQMVAYCIEQFIAQNDGGAGEQKKDD